ncbi:heavy metal-binding domain-containing protein [Aneurinibacillus aneurinilyticus]|uniref:heavy metal-binding domain-containing protein n=1 Tax=Aneurinibacillus aneurinilyticus TaxID=1391 RepID=UPI0023EFB23A|nr:heavy metal-binding domain-containing protein [Aneurinibacillus aneurinilyticus]
MSLFGKKEKQGEPIVEQEKSIELDMLITTLENIGKPYEILGLVTERRIEDVEWNYETVTAELARKAKNMGADAIVGFRYSPCYDRSVVLYAYGTAVKFK